MNSTAPNEEDAALFGFAMQLATANVLPMVLKAALELDILEIMARESCTAAGGGWMSPAEIATRLPTTNPEAPVMVDRVLRLLASHSILTCKLRDVSHSHEGKGKGKANDRVYGLAPICKFLTKNEDGASIAPLCVMNHHKVFVDSWFHLKDAILEGGIPFNKAHGMSAFEYPVTDPRFNKIFNWGMSDHSTVIMKKILDTYNGFEGLNTLVDVGGGTGAVLDMIVSIYPSIKGINFDLPHVIEDAPPLPGVEHVGGDMFVSVPRGDAIFMKWICHDWSDEHCLKLLKNCYTALPDHGKVIVAEGILPLVPDESFNTKSVIHLDCVMLAYNPGGKERTETEFENLAKGAGFEGFKIACCTLNTYVMEFIKKP